MGRALGLFQDAFGGTKRKIKGEKLEIKTPEYILSSASLRKTAKRLKKNPATLARLDNSKKIREQAGKIAKRNEDFATKNNDTVRKDIQLSLRLIENGGFTALFDALKLGAVLPAIAGPMIMYGLREDSAQTVGLLFPET